MSPLAELRRSMADISGVLSRAFVAGAEREARFGPLRVARQTPVEFEFDVTNPEAVRWAEQHAAELILGISRETEGAIRTVITSAFRDQIDVRNAARIIRSSIGLNEQQAIAVYNLQQRILDNPGKRLYAGKVPIRVPKKGMSPQQLDRVIEAYTRRLINQRAQTIARTETITASNQGQRQLWRQAVQDGWLSGKEQRRWIAFDPCPICLDLDGQTRGLEESFDGIDAPPAHPRCRCSVSLTKES